MRKRLRNLADQALSSPTTILSFPRRTFFQVLPRQNWDSYKLFDEFEFDRLPS